MIPNNELVILDTNVLVAYIRANKLATLIESRYELRSRIEKPILSVVTIGEILALSYKFGWAAGKRDTMLNLITEMIIVDINIQDILNRYAEISYYLSTLKPAVTIQQNDMWIAATASVTEAHLITTDTDYCWLSPRWLKLELVDERDAV